MTACTHPHCLSVALAAVALAACQGTSPGVPTTAAPSLSRPPPAAPPTEEEQIDKLVAFTRLLGDLRYFHPSDEGATADAHRFRRHLAGGGGGRLRVPR